jgi:hypothetical protein
VTSVPADIVALLPRYVDDWDPDATDSDDVCFLVHDVDWADNLVGCCRDCGRQFDPDDVTLPEEVRVRVDQAAWDAGLIREVAS